MALRFTLTAVVLVWFVRPPWQLLGKLFWIALVSAAIQYSLTFTGLKGLDASTASLIIQLEVPFGALLAWIFFQDRLGWGRAFGMLLAFIGVMLIAGEPRYEDNLTSILLLVGGALTWAIGQIMIKALGVVGGFTLIAWVAVWAAPQLFVRLVAVRGRPVGSHGNRPAHCLGSHLVSGPGDDGVGLRALVPPPRPPRRQPGHALSAPAAGDRRRRRGTVSWVRP